MGKKIEDWLLDAKERAKKYLAMLRVVENARADKLFLECVDGCTILTVELDAWDETTPFIWLRLYGDYRPGFWHRFRHAWENIRYGELQHADDILLTLESAHTLADYIAQETKRGVLIRNEMAFYQQNESEGENDGRNDA